MLKYFHFLYKNSLDKEMFLDILKDNYQKDFDLQFSSSDNYGVIKAENDFYETLTNIHPLLLNDLGCQITFLASFENGELSKKALLLAEKKLSNTVTNLSTVYFYSLLNGNELTLYLDKLFNNISYELIQTGLTFVQCGMNACLAARQLYIHRNTFNYRLNSFIEKTTLDLRDYDNALVFDFYEKQNLLK